MPLSGLYVGLGGRRNNTSAARTASTANQLVSLYGANLLHLWMAQDRVMSGANALSVAPRVGVVSLVNYNTSYFTAGDPANGYPSISSPDSSTKKLIATPSAPVKTVIVVASCSTLPFSSYRVLARQTTTAELVGNSGNSTWITTGHTVYRNGIATFDVQPAASTYECVQATAVSGEISIGGYELYSNTPWLGNIYMIALLDIEQSAGQRTALAAITKDITG